MDKRYNLDFVLDNINFSYFKKSKIHGIGLFADRTIEKDSILGILDGQIMQWNDFDELSSFYKTKLSDDLHSFFFMEWNALDTSTLLVRPYRTKYSYINHSYMPNLKILYNPIRIVTTKKIKKDEEFLLDYTKEPLREEYLKGHGKTYL